MKPAERKNEMTNAIYMMEEAGREAFDVFTKEGRFAGLIVKRQDGTWRHYYNMGATKFSARKFPTAWAALENLHARRVRRLAAA